MSRYRGPRIKIVRRLGLLAGLTNKTVKTKANLNNKLVTKKKVSQYRVRLEEKQKLRFYYGLTERQLLRYVRIARNTKGSAGSVLLQLLEMRLDNTLFRLGMTLTIPAARQLVNHGHILVNKRVVDIPSYCCKPQDMIAIRDRVASRDLIDRNLNSLQQKKIPSHLTLTTTNRTALVNQLVNRESIGVQINELLVVEYYSRQA
jgi:small subunit ribosomal protein S4